MIELLTTKLFIPRTRKILVSRSRLVERLNTGLDKKLTLIAAPAGFGKTTLLSEWIPKSPRCVTWLSLDESDNDQTRFWAYFISSLQGLRPDLGSGALALLRSSLAPPITSVLTTLINDISAFSDAFAIVLDDYHVIESQLIHEALTFLIDQLPKNMHLVITTRIDPPLPLARLRVDDWLTELRVNDLRFTTEEAAAFLTRAMGLNLSAEEVAALETRTEGWIAGLQIAALSMQGRSDVSEFINAFSGSHRHIIGYLVNEVINRNPKGTLDFLLQTSILKRLCGPLCDSVTGKSGGQEIIENLVNANMFVTPLDDEEKWYRYHHLFAEVLQARLQQNQPEISTELHLRASSWYEQNGFPDQAVYHVLESGDWPQALKLVERAGLIVKERGEFYKYKRWMDSIPKSEIVHKPRLYVDFAWATALDGDLDTAENMLETIGPRVRDDPVLKIDWLSAKVWAARGRGDGAQAIDLALEALAQPGSGSMISRCVLLMSLSLAYWHVGMVSEAADAAEEGLPLAKNENNWNVRAILLARIALAKAARGELLEAKKVYLRALKRASGTPDWIGGGIVQQCLAALYYELNDLEKAFAYAKQGLEYSKITGYGEVWVDSLRQLAYIYQAMGDTEQTDKSLDQAEQVIRAHHLPQIFLGALTASRCQIALRQGDLKRAKTWIDRFQGGYGGSIHYLKLPLEPAKMALAQGKNARAIEYLAQAHQQASQKGIRYAQIEIRILQALAVLDKKKSTVYISDALVLAEPEGYIRIFVDEGEPMRLLLLDFQSIIKKKMSDGVDTESLRLLQYTDKLLAAFSQHVTDEKTKDASLNERELDVLRLVATGRSNKEIAEILVVTVSTVKWYINSLYSKLGAKSRTHALALARELELI